MNEIRPPASYRFVVTNWFAWVIEAHHLGYSEADILLVLKTVGVLEQMRASLEKVHERR